MRAVTGQVCSCEFVRKTDNGRCPEENKHMPANITERAMLVNLTISQWTAVRHDKKITREVADSHGNQEDMGKYQKSLVAKSALEDIKRLASSARAEHYKRTLPWRDGGDRILSSAGYFDYTRAMSEYRNKWDSAVNTFCANYGQYVSDARTSLNSLFNDEDYPSDIRGKFGLTFDLVPMPTSEDFRVDLGTEETARIKGQIEKDSRAMLDRAMTNVWERLSGVVSHMVARLKAYQELPNGKVQNPFRDSLVSNITELLDLLPTLNLTDDVNIGQFASDIRASLTAYSPEQLRESEQLRADVASKADEILSKMTAFLG